MVSEAFVDKTAEEFLKEKAPAEAHEIAEEAETKDATKRAAEEKTKKETENAEADRQVAEMKARKEAQDSVPLWRKVFCGVGNLFKPNCQRNRPWMNMIRTDFSNDQVMPYYLEFQKLADELADENGLISRDKFMPAFKQLQLSAGFFSGENMLENSADKDGDGYISFDEFLGAVLGEQAQHAIPEVMGRVVADEEVQDLADTWANKPCSKDDPLKAPLSMSWCIGPALKTVALVASALPVVLLLVGISGSVFVTCNLKDGKPDGSGSVHFIFLFFLGMLAVVHVAIEVNLVFKYASIPYIQVAQTFGANGFVIWFLKALLSSVTSLWSCFGQSLFIAKATKCAKEGDDSNWLLYILWFVTLGKSWWVLLSALPVSVPTKKGGFLFCHGRRTFVANSFKTQLPADEIMLKVPRITAENTNPAGEYFYERQFWSTGITTGAVFCDLAEICNFGSIIAMTPTHAEQRAEEEFQIIKDKRPCARKGLKVADHMKIALQHVESCMPRLLNQFFFTLLLQVAINFCFQVDEFVEVLGKDPMSRKWFWEHKSIYFGFFLSLLPLRKTSNYLHKVMEFFRKAQEEIKNFKHDTTKRTGDLYVTMSQCQLCKEPTKPSDRAWYGKDDNGEPEYLCRKCWDVETLRAHMQRRISVVWTLQRVAIVVILYAWIKLIGAHLGRKVELNMLFGAVQGARARADL